MKIVGKTYKITDSSLGSGFEASLTDKVTEAKAALEEGTTAVLSVSTLLTSYKKKLEKSKLNTI